MVRGRDTITPDLFEVPQPAAPLAASMNYREEVSSLLGDVLHGCHLDRFEIAASVSRLTGRDVSKWMLDGYTSPARDDFNVPFYVIPALEVVCTTHRLTHWLAMKRGARVYVGKEALKAELGRLEADRDRIGHLIRNLKSRVGE